MLNVVSPILFPTQETSKYVELYFRGNGFTYLNDEILSEKNKTIKTNTYYNSFSVEKWNKYTEIKDLYLRLSCKGKIKLSVINTSLVYNQIIEKVLVNKYYDYDIDTEIIIDLTKYLKLEGMISFEIESISDAKIGNIAYCTSVDIKLPKLGLVICTYKREKYIDKFIDSYKKYRYNHLVNAIIVDNGNTLENSGLPKGIKIFKNMNYGGAGGFSRGMIEIKRLNEKKENHIDYIILMDDDIYIDFNIYYKLMAFLGLRKEEFENYFLAGTMCSLDNKEFQYERYAQWCGSYFNQMSPGFNLTNIRNLLENEIIERVDLGTAGWWFCCFSTKMLGVNNLPFPCFFRGDDVEFTIRNGSNIMTLNGINVWHEPFYKKYSITSEDYYLLRNTLVINTLYMNWISAFDNIKYLFRRFSKSIIKYDYASAELIIKALVDYSQGVSFFENVNPEKLNISLSKYNHKLIKISEIKKSYRYSDMVNKAINENDKSKLHKYFRFITFNGNLLPWFMAKGEGVSFVGYGARAINFYKKDSVLNYDPYSRKGYFTNRNFRMAVKLTVKFIKEASIYWINFEKIKRDYQINFSKLQTESFWLKYLGL